MELLEFASISPEQKRAGFITDEDPLRAGRSSGEGWLAGKRRERELEAFAFLFKELPTFPKPEEGRQILRREGFHLAQTNGAMETWHDGQGIVASLRTSGEQAVIEFLFQTIFGACLHLFRGTRYPFNLANGDTIFVNNIHAEPGVLQMLRMARPYVLLPWRVLPPQCYVQRYVPLEVVPKVQLIEFKPTISAEENHTIEELMALSGEQFERVGNSLRTTSGNRTRWWFKPFQAAICFVADTEEEAQGWLAFYLRLANHAHAQGCRLTERACIELQLSGKLCCKALDSSTSPVGSSRWGSNNLKVQLKNGQPVILDYCDDATPEIA
jgi:hypothetical protein